MTNQKDSFRTQLEEAARRADFRHTWSGRTKISNFRNSFWRLVLTWNADEQPASLTAYQVTPGQGEAQVADAILAEQHDGGPVWLFDVVKRFFGYTQDADRLEVIQDAAVPAVADLLPEPGDQPHPDRGNALELLEQVSAEMVAEDEQRHIIAVAEQAGWMIHDYPVGSDWDKAYLSKMNLGLKGFFDKVYRFTAADTADLVTVFFLRHQVYGAHLDSPGRQAFRYRGDNRLPWITDTVARWLVNPTDTLNDGTDAHLITQATLRPVSPFVRMTAEQADKIPAGTPVSFMGTTPVVGQNYMVQAAEAERQSWEAAQTSTPETDRWDRLKTAVDAASEAIGVPLAAVPNDPNDALVSSVRRYTEATGTEGLPQRVPKDYWPTVEPEDSAAEKAEQRARHLAADMFTSYWDGRDADMFDADDIGHLLTLLDIARKAGR
ncbi:hypothetical protein [Nocardia phage KYD2]|nr:hypothetical protein [Nocardia phage KYD2]